MCGLCRCSQLIFPFLDLKTIYFDLGIEHRDETDDQVTIDAAHAILVRSYSRRCTVLEVATALHRGIC